MLVILAMLCCSFSACGGNFNKKIVGSSLGTTKGAYTVRVVGTSATTTAASTFTLTVQ
jgi:hypothetical protein